MKFVVAIGIWVFLGAALVIFIRGAGHAKRR